MKTNETTNQETEVEFGDYGPIYRQFAGKPQKAIEFLRKQQTGECINALNRDDIGDISLVWGEVTDPKDTRCARNNGS